MQFTANRNLGKLLEALISFFYSAASFTVDVKMFTENDLFSSSRR